MRNNLISILCIFLLVVILFMAYSYTSGSAQLTDNDPLQLSEGVSFVNRTANRRTAFDYADATSEYIFFSYSQDNCVDAYSYDSEFCYSIYLPAYSNGIIMVRCIDDMLFICDKTDAVYIYNGTTQVNVLSEKDAEENGYTVAWFRNNHEEIGVNVDRKNISLTDESNHVLLSIETPASIKRQLPYIDFGRETNIFISLVGLAGLAVAGGITMYKAFQKTQKKSKRLV